MTARPVVVLLAIALIVCTNLLRVSATALYNPNINTSNVTTTVIPASNNVSTPVTAASSIALSATTISTPKTQQPTILTNCTANTTFTMPSAVDTTTVSDGLTIVDDIPATYTLRATTLNDLRNQLNSCNGKSTQGFAAVTNYWLSWQYNWAPNNLGTCRLQSVRVGLHINQLLPSYAPPTDLPSSLISSWQSFSASLQTHENGHAMLDKQYATQLTTILQSLNAPCSSIDTQANSLAQSYVASLNAANNAYDAQTNHGATQGAIL